MSLDTLVHEIETDSISYFSNVVVGWNHKPDPTPGE